VCCALHRYDIFFSSLYRATNNFLVVRICRLTDENNPKGLSFGRWLKQATREKRDNLDMSAMQKVLNDYTALLGSEKYFNVRRLRNQEYVHDDETAKQPENVKETDPTWKDLFEIIEELQKIRNRAGIAGACTPSLWINDMYDLGTHHLLKILEKDAHNDDTHQEIIKGSSN